MKTTFAFVSLWIFSTFLVAGERTSISGVSQSNSTVSTTGGIDAVGINPARLGRFDRPRMLDEMIITISHDSLVLFRELAETTRVYTQTIMKDSVFLFDLITSTNHDTLIFDGDSATVFQISHDTIIVQTETRQVPHDSTFYTKETYEVNNSKIEIARHDTTIFVPEELPNVTLSLLPALSFNFGTDLINYDIYSKYFTGTIVNGKKIGKFLTNEDKQDVLSIFPEGLAETHFDFETRLFGLSIHNNDMGNFAFTVTERFNMNLELPKDYLRLPLYGLDSSGSLYSLKGTSINAQELREYAFTYAREIPELIPYVEDFTAGFSIKILQGLFYFDLDNYDVQFGNPRTNDSIGRPMYDIYGSANIHYFASVASVFDSGASFSPSPHDAGNALAFDFGISLRVFEKVRIGMSVLDIGEMQWSRFPIEGSFSSQMRISDVTKKESQDSVDAFLNDLEENISELKGDTTSSFSSELPTAFLFGASMRTDIPYLGNWLLAIQYKQGFNDALGNSKRARISFGGEYRPWNFLPLRMGVAFGGKDRFSISGGIGLDFYYFNWDIGSENIGFLFTPKGFQQFSFGTGIRLRF